MMNVFLAVAALVTSAGILGRRAARVHGPARTPAIVCTLLVGVGLPFGIFLAGMDMLDHYYDWQRVRSFILIIPCCWGLIECVCWLESGRDSSAKRVLAGAGGVLAMIVLSCILLMEINTAIKTATTPPRTVSGMITRIVDIPRAGKTPAVRQIFLNRTCYDVPNARWFATLRPGDQITFVTEPWGDNAFQSNLVAPTRMGGVVVGACLYLAGLALVRLGWAIWPPDRGGKGLAAQAGTSMPWS